MVRVKFTASPHELSYYTAMMIPQTRTDQTTSSCPALVRIVMSGQPNNGFTIGGSPEFQQRIRKLLHEYDDMFSYNVKGKAMTVSPITFTVANDWWETPWNRLSSHFGWKTNKNMLYLTKWWMTCWICQEYSHHRQLLSYTYLHMYVSWAVTANRHFVLFSQVQ